MRQSVAQQCSATGLETGRIRFRRARFQTPNSVSFFALTESWERTQWFPPALLLMCQKLTEFACWFYCGTGFIWIFRNSLVVRCLKDKLQELVRKLLLPAKNLQSCGTRPFQSQFSDSFGVENKKNCGCGGGNMYDRVLLPMPCSQLSTESWVMLKTPAYWLVWELHGWFSGLSSLAGRGLAGLRHIRQSLHARLRRHCSHLHVK